MLLQQISQLILACFGSFTMLLLPLMSLHIAHCTMPTIMLCCNKQLVLFPPSWTLYHCFAVTGKPVDCHLFRISHLQFCCCYLSCLSAKAVADNPSTELHKQLVDCSHSVNFFSQLLPTFSLSLSSPLAMQKQLPAPFALHHCCCYSCPLTSFCLLHSHFIIIIIDAIIFLLLLASGHVIDLQSFAAAAFCFVLPWCGWHCPALASSEYAIM